MTDFSVKQAQADDGDVEFREDVNAAWQPALFFSAETGMDGRVLAYTVQLVSHGGFRVAGPGNIRNIPRMTDFSVEQQKGRWPQ